MVHSEPAATVSWYKDTMLLDDTDNRRRSQVIIRMIILIKMIIMRMIVSIKIIIIRMIIVMKMIILLGGEQTQPSHSENEGGGLWQLLLLRHQQPGQV